METNYDAFTQGISVGGMRTKNDIKILLCYTLKGLDAPISKAGLNQVLQTTGLANFFEVNDALSSLTVAGVIMEEKRQDDVYYSLTPLGFDTAEKLETDLPMHVRRTAVAAAIDVLAREKAKGGTDVKITKLSKGYHITLSIFDGTTLMMQTVLYAADSLQADSISENFLRDPGKLYSGIIDAVTH